LGGGLNPTEAVESTSAPNNMDEKEKIMDVNRKPATLAEKISSFCSAARKIFNLNEDRSEFYAQSMGKIADRNEYVARIHKIKWHKYWAAYPSLEMPRDLKALIGDDFEAAVEAAENLWASLCHQHVMFSPAALPVYDFAIWAYDLYDRHVAGFSSGEESIEIDYINSSYQAWSGDQEALSNKVPFAAWRREKLNLSEAEYILNSLLILFHGFALSTTAEFRVKYKKDPAPEKWEEILRANLIRDQSRFERYRRHPHMLLSEEANGIIEKLRK